MGHKIRLLEYPERIISLVPSLTELLFDLGLDDEVVGVTDYCIFPEEKVTQRTRIGGPKKFDFAAIDELKPDLIVGDKEENYLKGIHQLQHKYPVWVSDIISIDDALHMIRALGKLVNRRTEAEHLSDTIDVGLRNLPNHPVVKVAYLIWKNPYMAVGSETFIDSMLNRCGFINIFANKRRYPKIQVDELEEAQVILLSSEPYSFTSEDIDFFKTRYPTHFVYFIDGTVFSWYGSRLQYAPAYITHFREKLLKDISERE
ncbi:MAG: ABC transporter substrate-binding protein [Deltaproteobacteria bacterium]|nr:ABC transporter substrate-binding protein [Deltaproteobacteria bacterium]